MRSIVLAMLAAGMALMAPSARAQTYDPSYPVCKRVFGDPAYFECYFTSMEQCREGIRGISAECVVNPFYANTREPAPAPDRKPRSN